VGVHVVCLMCTSLLFPFVLLCGCLVVVEPMSAPFYVTRSGSRYPQHSVPVLHVALGGGSEVWSFGAKFLGVARPAAGCCEGRVSAQLWSFGVFRCMPGFVADCQSLAGCAAGSVCCNNGTVAATVAGVLLAPKEAKPYWACTCTGALQLGKYGSGVVRITVPEKLPAEIVVGLLRTYC
jgi:hypothetical protein